MTLLASGCATSQGGSAQAICDVYRAQARAHAGALLDGGSDEAVVTGAQLLAAMDAACGGAP